MTRGVRPLEGEEARDLAADAVHPLGDGLRVVQRALGGRLGVADQAGGAADQAERPVAGLLEAAHGEDLDEVAEVQAGRGRVEAAIERDGAVRERLAQCVLVSGQGDQPAPLQLVDDVRHGSVSPRLVWGLWVPACPPTGSGRSRAPGRRSTALARGVGAVGADGGVGVDPVAPGVGGALAADAGTRAAADRGGLGRGTGEDAERSAAVGAGVGAVEGAVDAERGGEPGRALGEVALLAGGGPPGAREVGAGCDPPGPEQHPAGPADRTAHQVQAVPHAVGEVDVGVAGRAEHDGVAVGAAPVGVGAGVVGAVVRLDLGEPQFDGAVVGGPDQGAAEQVGGDLQDGPVEERALQRNPFGWRDHEAGA